jgi:DNA mismatch repair protein MutS
VPCTTLRMMTFTSILFAQNENKPDTEAREAPPYFADLNLDQVVRNIIKGKKEYNLTPFFQTPLPCVEAIRYRQEVMQDLENEALLANINTFAEQMAVVRRRLNLSRELEFEHHKKGWFLEAALVYCQAVTDLAHNLAQTGLQSRGLLAFRDYIARYVVSDQFETLRQEAQATKAALATVTYSIIIQVGKFRVRPYEGEPDYSIQIEEIFAKFQQGAVKDYLADLDRQRGMNHIEAKILEFVARLYPEPFATLDQFCAGHAQFMDETIRIFDREIQFYVAYLNYMASIKQKKLSFCYPQITTTREVCSKDSFDLALAHTLLYTDEPVVGNDFFLQEPERIIIVSGPNQGGKTTFARTFGQLHYLASLGCPVPGQEARLFLFDQILTHFEREEDIRNLRGKLQDDLVRIHDLLTQASPDSILVLNEIFASTTLEDAVFLSNEIMTRILELDLLCVWVTFIEELATASEKTVSMVSTVVPDNPAERTFKVVRKPADGLAYALSIVEKHGLTYEQIKERIAP